MRPVLARLGLVAALALPAAGCATTIDARALGVPASLASPAGQPAKGTAFSVTSHAVYGLLGIVNIHEPSVERAIAAQLVGGKKVADVRVRVRSRFTDLLISVLTAGLIIPRSVTIDGVITE